MPVRIFSGLQAWENLRANPFGEWPTRENPDKNRIEPLCTPAFQPTFKLEYGEKIFTIGSCFARNIERALLARGFDVVTSHIQWPVDVVTNSGPELLNNYGVASIENEIRWALDPQHPFRPEMSIFELAPDNHVDIHMARLKPTAFDKVVACRDAVIKVSRMAADCRVVIMTLGLSECWFDKVSGDYINVTPPRQLVIKYPERFELHVLSFEETMKHLRSAIDTLRRFSRTDQRVLLTVSPVPMKATFVNKDVLIANTYSKSLLRTVAEHIVSEYEHIDYFPSYESVVLSDRKVAWLDDQIHVQPAVVASNVERMIEAYRPDAAVVSKRDALVKLKEAEEEILAGNSHSAMRILEPLHESALTDPQAILTYANLCIDLRRPKDALEAVANLPAGDWQRRLVEGRALILDKRLEEACQRLDAALHDKPRNTTIMRILVGAYIQREMWDDALVLAKRWTELSKGQNAEPLRQIALIHMSRNDVQQAEVAYQAALRCEKSPCRVVLDYAEFLIAQKRFNEAARMMQHAVPDTPLLKRRFAKLSVYLPTLNAESK